MTSKVTPPILPRRQVRIELTEDQYQALAEIAKNDGTTMADVARHRIIHYPDAHELALALKSHTGLLDTLITAIAARKR